jgi:hypothetical protein
MFNFRKSSSSIVLVAKSITALHVTWWGKRLDHDHAFNPEQCTDEIEGQHDGYSVQFHIQYVYESVFEG